MNVNTPAGEMSGVVANSASLSVVTLNVTGPPVMFVAHALLWRIHMLEDSPGPMDVLEAANDEGFWFGSLSFDGIPLASGDVAVDGSPIHEAPPGRVKLLRNVALGRLRAASWLVGLHPLYSEAPVSVY